MVEQYLREAMAKFNEKAASDPKLKKELEGIRRTVVIEVTDGETYNFILDNSRVEELNKGSIENPDIKVSGTNQVFEQLRTGELRPMKALALKKIQVQATLQDMLRLRKFF